MANSILGGKQHQQVAFDANLANQFKQFQQTFNGDPKSIVDQMVRSGRISPQQLNQAIAAAKQLNGAFRLV